MSYENPRLPEEVNVSRESALAEFLRLAAGLALVIGVLVLALEFGGGWLARQLPYRYESRWTGDEAIGLDAFDTREGAVATRDYLQGLADSLASVMDLPEGMQPRVHLIEEKTPNAFASLGGHIVVTRGLYELMPSENGLAMVLAHELAHLRARDPISALGGHAAASLVLALLGGDATALTTQVAVLTQLGYSRHVEQRADAAAIAALIARYGHAGGAAALFEQLADANSARGKIPSLLSTHPADAERIERIRAAARGWDPLRQPLRGIPRAQAPPRPSPS